jgi:hypothetical protein
MNKHIHALVYETRDSSMLGFCLIKTHMEAHKYVKEDAIISTGRLIFLYALSLQMTFEDMMIKLESECPCVGYEWYKTNKSKELKVGER